MRIGGWRINDEIEILSRWSCCSCSEVRGFCDLIWARVIVVVVALRVSVWVVHDLQTREKLEKWENNDIINTNPLERFEYKRPSPTQADDIKSVQENPENQISKKNQQKNPSINNPTHSNTQQDQSDIANTPYIEEKKQYAYRNAIDYRMKTQVSKTSMTSSSLSNILYVFFISCQASISPASSVGYLCTPMTT